MELSLNELPAVEALGPLFKLTEVHLGDDGSSEMREVVDTQEPNKFSNGDQGSEKGYSSKSNGFGSLPEDLELAEKMSILGLPFSFQTNKEKRNVFTNGKRKGRKMGNPQCLIEIDDLTLESIMGAKDESLCNVSDGHGRGEMPKHEIISDLDSLSNLSLERGDSANSNACTSTISYEHDHIVETPGLGFDHSFGCISEFRKNTLDKAEGPGTNEISSEESCLVNEDVDCNKNETSRAMDLDTEVQSIDIIIQDADVDAITNSLERDNATIVLDDLQTVNSGEWMAYWDEYYMKVYFYNVKTEESTWDPPQGMEHLAYSSDMADESKNKNHGSAENEKEKLDLGNSNEVEASCDLQPRVYTAGNVNDADDHSSNSSLKRKKRGRRTRSNINLSVSTEEMQGVLRQVTPSISKYWCQRYLLFSRFDHGIKMDEEGWFSVTPEPLSKHHAIRCGGGVIIDFFTGVGGNAIQFAQQSKHVIAIDIDPNKIDYARHNAAIYGVENNIDFIKGDSFSLASALKADTVFMSPPWGGPDYSKVKKFDISMLKPHDGKHLFDVGTRIASKIVMFLPRNVDINQLAEISLSATPPWSVEVEKNYLNGRLKGVTAYFVNPHLHNLAS